MHKRFGVLFIMAAVVLLMGGRTYAAGFEDVREHVLDNGLKVLLLEEHKAPVAVFQIWYKVGSVDEPYDKAGLSHILEHMMFKGTEKNGPKTFSRTVQKYGGSDNAFTSHDYTAYFQTFASDYIGLSLELESDRMKNLLLTDESFQSERAVVAEERRMRYDNDPESALSELLQAATFKLHPYRWPIIGWMETIENWKLGDLQNHYKTYYVPNNATIVMVGDFDADAMLGEIDRYFGKIPRGPEPKHSVLVEPEQSGERRVFLKKEAQLPTIYMSYHAPTLTHPDTFALDVLEVVLSGGKSARLYKSLVYGKQIAQYAGAGYYSVSRYPETFTFSAGVMPDKTVEEVEAAIYEEIERIKTEPVGDREMKKALNQIESSYIMGQDSNFYRAMLIGRYETVASWKYLASYLDGIRAVTPEDVMRVANEYLVEENRTVGILQPLPIGEPGGEQAAMPPHSGGHH
jgi:zinc protease